MSLPVIVGFYMISNHQVYGVDSWYWLKVSHIPLILFNLFPIGMCVLIIAVFYKADGDFYTKLILATIFLSNIFIGRFLEFELDDFLMYAILFPILAIKPKIGAYLGVGVVIAYLIVHGFAYPFFITGGRIAEATANYPFTILAFLPSIFLFALNDKWKYLAILSIFILLIPQPKITNPLPLFLLPAYISMIQNTEKKIKFPKYLMMAFCMITFIMVISEAVRQVNANTEAFDRLCDVETKICYNYNYVDWGFGHYFAYLGYKNYATNFGVCQCTGIECFNETWC